MKQSRDFFWPSYVDLMTALFLTMLVLFVLSYKLFTDERDRLKAANDRLNAKVEQLEVIERIEKSLQAVMNDKSLFKYDAKFRRYTLTRPVGFAEGQWDLSQPNKSLQNPNSVYYLDSTGRKLRTIVDSLLSKKRSDQTLRDVSYVLAIIGSASDLYRDAYRRQHNTYAYAMYENGNYILSYQRAKALVDFWKRRRIVDFDAPKYHDVVELVLAGNGFGGVGRYNDTGATPNEEYKNQRFLIQIIPKVGKVIHE